jgi:glutathione S-transferase
VRETERIIEQGVLGPIARVIHTTNSPLGWPPQPEIAAYFRKALPEACHYLDQRLADGRPFLMGERPTMPDCTLGAALQFGRFGGVAPDAELGHLARWDRDYSARDVVKPVIVL